MNTSTNTSLMAIAADIEAAHQAAQDAARAALGHALRAGELLIAAKDRRLMGRLLTEFKANIAAASAGAP
jgi:hypothetical protein